VTELHPVIYDLVPSVARTIHRRYKTHVEFDDIKQELMAWAMTRIADHTEDLMEIDENKRRHNEQRIAWQMRRVAERYARKEKASKSGYQTNDEAYYDSPTLGQLLPFVIASILDGTVLEQAQEMINDGQPKGSSSPAEGGNLLANLIDIKRGYLQLEQDDQMLLRLRHHERFTLQQIAQVLECATSTADRRCVVAYKSLRRLQDNLGGISSGMA
jgi:DNA-directed RNA polymerase specialized sigma24 family protein